MNEEKEKMTRLMGKTIDEFVDMAREIYPDDTGNMGGLALFLMALIKEEDKTHFESRLKQIKDLK